MVKSVNIFANFIMWSYNFTTNNEHCNKRINRMLEMTSDAPTNAGKHVTSNIASGHNQRYTKDSNF